MLLRQGINWPDTRRCKHFLRSVFCFFRMLLRQAIIWPETRRCPEKEINAHVGGGGGACKQRSDYHIKSVFSCAAVLQDTGVGEHTIMKRRSHTLVIFFSCGTPFARGDTRAQQNDDLTRMRVFFSCVARRVHQHDNEYRAARMSEIMLHCSSGRSPAPAVQTASCG